ncbi:MAG: MFS transporter [Kiritimatiellia bacterium]
MKRDYSNMPFAPARVPFFYGWVILPLGALGFLMSAPGQTYGVSPFTDSLIATLGLTRVKLSLAYMYGTIASSLCLPFAGRVYDRLGARVVAPAASFALGLVLVMLSQCDKITAGAVSLLGLADTTAPAFAVILTLFFLLRLSGQGVLTMVSRNMMMKWFDLHRGLVTAIAGMVIAPAFSASPALFNMLVERVGWRGAWLWLSILIGGVFTLVAVVFFRDNPESCGLKPDGALAEKKLGARPHPDHRRRQYTLPDALRTYTFWIFVLSLALFGLYMTALSFHASSIFESAGMDRKTGYMIFLYAAGISVILRPLVGWLCDRVPLKYLLMPMLAGIIVSSLGLRVLGPGLPMWTVVAGNGLCGATLGTLAAVTWPNFYGRRHLGTISGFNMSAMVFASAIGPWVFGKSLSVSGNYTRAVIGVASAAGLLIILAWRADNPQDTAVPAPPSP